MLPLSRVTIRNPAIRRSKGRNIQPLITMVGRLTSLDSQPTRWVAAVLAKRGGALPDAIQIADGTIAVWSDIISALKSIIGREGVAALYDRSVALSARTYPWLEGSSTGNDHSVDLDGLRAVIAQQNTDDAAAGSNELLQTFYKVLVSLIGQALCEQMLASVREDLGSRRSRDL
jgi:hypothetical protein